MQSRSIITRSSPGRRLWAISGRLKMGLTKLGKSCRPAAEKELRNKVVFQFRLSGGGESVQAEPIEHMSSHVSANGGGDHPKTNGDSRLQAAPAVSPAGGFLSEASLGDLIRIVFRHRRAALYFAGAVMLLTVLDVIFAPRQYCSEAKLLVRLGRENVGLDATTTLGQTPPTTAIPTSREEEINTVVAILESRALLEKVVDAVGPQTILNPITYPLRESTPPAAKPATDAAGDVVEPSRGILGPLYSGLERLGLKSPLSLREKAVVQLRKHLTIEAAKKSNVILLSHEGPSPKVSQAIIARLIDFYLDEHVRMNRTPRAHQFLKEQAAKLRAQLVLNEDQVRSLKNATGLAAPADQRQNLVLRIGRLEDDLKTSESAAAAAAAEIEQLDRRLKSMSPTQVLGAAGGYPNLAADGMRQQLYALQLKEKDLASRVTDKHVELRFVRQQIATARKVVDSLEPSRTQTTVGPNHNYDELRLSQAREEVSLAALRAKATTLRTQLADGGKRCGLSTTTRCEWPSFSAIR